MPTSEELDEALWEGIKSERTIMLGLDGVEDGHARPMTGLIEGHKGPIWFFTATDNALVQKVTEGSRAIATFVSKNHDLFATIHGGLSVSTDRATIDRLSNPFIAAWYKGKDDPKLILLRLDTERAEIWEDASSFVAGIKTIFGGEPRKDYRDKVANVSLT